MASGGFTYVRISAASWAFKARLPRKGVWADPGVREPSEDWGHGRNRVTSRFQKGQSWVAGGMEGKERGRRGRGSALCWPGRDRWQGEKGSGRLDSGAGVARALWPEARDDCPLAHMTGGRGAVVSEGAARSTYLISRSPPDSPEWSLAPSAQRGTCPALFGSSHMAQ